MAKPTVKKPLGQDRARKLLQANLSPRYRRLDELEAWVDGRQYVDRRQWDDPGECPLSERAPSIVDDAVKQSIKSNSAYILGEGKWPAVTSFSSEDDTDVDPEFGLSEEDSETLDSTIEKVIKQSKFVAVATECLSSGQRCGTTVAVYSMRNGKLRGESIHAKWCNPTFSDDVDGEVVSLEIRYPYVDTYWDQRASQWAERCLIYRRLIDAKQDTVFLPTEASDEGTEPDWEKRIDKAKSIVHDLGFCPVRWHRHLKEVCAANEIDGVAIHEGKFPLIEKHDIALSQKDRAAFYCGDPQMIETGVADGEEPAAAGRQASAQSMGNGWSARTQTAGRSAAKRRGARTIWTYSSPEAKAFYLTLGADGLGALEKNCQDLRTKLQESLQVILLDPANMKWAGQFSNRAIRTMLRRQLDSCDKIRENFGDGFILPSICMMLRIAYTMYKRQPGGVYLPGIEKAAPILARFERTIEGAVNSDGAADAGAVTWFDPHLDLKWGPYFEPDPEEENKIVQGVCQAYQAGVITRKTAIERLPETFNIGNADEYIKSVELEEKVAHNRQLDLTHAMGKLAAGDDSDDDTNDDGTRDDTDEGLTDDGADGTATKNKGGRSVKPARRAKAKAKARNSRRRADTATDGDTK